MNTMMLNTKKTLNDSNTRGLLNNGRAPLRIKARCCRPDAYLRGQVYNALTEMFSAPTVDIYMDMPSLFNNMCDAYIRYYREYGSGVDAGSVILEVIDMCESNMFAQAV